MELKRISGEKVFEDEEANEFLKEVKIVRMGYLNQHSVVPTRSIEEETAPLYVLIDVEKKKVVMAPARETASKSSSKEELKTFFNLYK